MAKKHPFAISRSAAVKISRETSIPVFNMDTDLNTVHTAEIGDVCFVETIDQKFEKGIVISFDGTDHGIIVLTSSFCDWWYI